MNPEYYKNRKQKAKDKESGEVRFGIQFGFFRFKKGIINFVDSLCYKYNLSFHYGKFKISLITTRINFKIVGKNDSLKKFIFEFNKKYDIKLN